MKRTILNDNLIATLIEKAQTSEKREEIEKYIKEVSERCLSLCNAGEALRVLNEYKLLIDNLIKELNFA